MRWVAAMGLVAIYLFGAVVLVSGTAGPAEARKKVNTSNQKPSTQQNFGKGNRQGHHGHGHHGHRHHGRGGGGIGIGGFGLGDGINIYIGR
jgi:hypothetical protein